MKKTKTLTVIIISLLTLKGFSQIEIHPKYTTVCEGDDITFAIVAPDSLQQFQWQKKAELSTKWSDIEENDLFSGEQSDILSLKNVPFDFNNYQFRCIVSAEGTNSDTSDAAKLQVIGKIGDVPRIIEENSVVCQDTQMVYKIEKIAYASKYLWYYNGNLQTGDTLEYITIDFIKPGNNTLEIEPNNQCFTGNSLLININVIKRPERYSIVPKRGGTVLISYDKTPDMMFQWGFTDKNRDDFIVCDDTLRYAVFSERIDSNKYDYWVKTYFKEDTYKICSTKTYYDPSTIIPTLDVANYEEHGRFIVFPNPCIDFFSLTTDPATDRIKKVIIRNSIGVIIAQRLMERNIPGIVLTSSMAEYVPGTYYVEIIFEDQSNIVRKVIKH